MDVNYELKNCPDRSWDQIIIDLVGAEHHMLTEVTERKLFDPGVTISIAFWFHRDNWMEAKRALERVSVYFDENRLRSGPIRLIPTAHGIEGSLADEDPAKDLDEGKPPKAPFKSVVEAVEALESIVILDRGETFGYYSESLISDFRRMAEVPSRKGSYARKSVFAEITSVRISERNRILEASRAVCETPIENSVPGVTGFLARISDLIQETLKVLKKGPLLARFEMLFHQARTCELALKLAAWERHRGRLADQPQIVPAEHVPDMNSYRIQKQT
ncbi:MAG: hypothetical protein AB7G54_00420 [Methyloceanibacter sp.]